MTTEVVTPVDDEVNALDTFQLLKEKADLLGIKYSPNISETTLAKRVKETLEEGTKSKEDKELDEAANVERLALIKEANRLVRCIVTPTNPVKSNLPGTIIAVSNNTVGSFKKYIQFNTEYHIPYIIFKALKDKKEMYHYTTKVDGKEVTRNKLMPQFNITELPPLTQEELTALAKKQALRSGEE